MENRYSIKELQELLEKAEKYEALEKAGRLLVLPHKLNSTVYCVVEDCRKCGKAVDASKCTQKKAAGCKWKVMQGVFTIDMIGEYGKNVFGTEPEAVIAAVSRK